MVFFKKVELIVLAAVTATGWSPTVAAFQYGQPAAANPGQGQMSRLRAARLRELRATAAQAEMRIAASANEREALASVDTSAEARAILLRNGFTEQQLQGIPVRLGRLTSEDGTQRIKIEVRCCPITIIISW